MDLKVNLDHDLWEAIEKNYENESYSSAILDAMHLLTDTIRNKTGLEGDGSSLIGQAFGGNNPKIQLNKLQTDSEKNVQKGIQDILRGLYTAIRNPRSHDKHSDTKEEADSIIYFIGYLLNVIDKSKVSFEEEIFLRRVFDKHYVRTEEYSKLLVSEIPKRQRTNIAITIILKRKGGDIYNLGYFFKALLDELEDSEISRVYKVIGEELKYTSSDEDIRTILHIAPAKYWGKLDKVVKIRVENILLEDVKMGRYNLSSEQCRFGSLGTWIETEHLENFEGFSEWTKAIVDKMLGDNEEEDVYIKKFFWDKICKANYNNLDFWLKFYFQVGLKNKDEKIVNRLEQQIMFDEKHPWWEVFKEELKDFPHMEYTDLPF